MDHTRKKRFCAESRRSAEKRCHFLDRQTVV
nr:MAG TPA: hypothetical protein [Caudoviricetes sp.]